MEATVSAPRFNPRRFWKRYGGTIVVLTITLPLIAMYEFISRAQRQALSDFLQTYRGGTEAGLRLRSSVSPS